MELVITLILLLFFVFALFQSVIIFRKAVNSKNWPTQVCASLEVKHYKSQGIDYNFPNYNITAKYTYCVNDLEYFGERIYWGRSKVIFATESRGLKLINYLEQKNIKVFYNPNNHEESVLISDNLFELKLNIIVAIIFTTILLASILFNYLPINE